MSYTAKKLSELSGISVRTLHWYDKIGLLKPSYYGENGYRYYEKAQLLLLQQILLYRELGFKLETIKHIVQDPSFDLITALEEHQKKLEEQAITTAILINTIRLTINDLKGANAMSDKALYQGFSEWIKEKDESAYFIGEYDEESTSVAEKIVLQSVKNDPARANWTKADFEQHMDKINSIFNGIVNAMEAGSTPIDGIVQKYVKAHYEYSTQFYSLTPIVYASMAELYRVNLIYRKQLDPYHPDFALFLAKAMENYSKRL